LKRTIGSDWALQSNPGLVRHVTQFLQAPDIKGQLVKVHFPSPEHSSHYMHEMLAKVRRVEDTGEVFHCEMLTGRQRGEFTRLHLYEIRLLTPLEVLACLDVA